MEVLAGIEGTAKAWSGTPKPSAPLSKRAGKLKSPEPSQLPAIAAPAVPVLYIEMDGTGI